MEMPDFLRNRKVIATLSLLSGIFYLAVFWGGFGLMAIWFLKSEISEKSLLSAIVAAAASVFTAWLSISFLKSIEFKKSKPVLEKTDNLSVDQIRDRLLLLEFLFDWFKYDASLDIDSHIDGIWVREGFSKEKSVILLANKLSIKNKKFFNFYYYNQEPWIVMAMVFAIMGGVNGFSAELILLFAVIFMSVYSLIWMIRSYDFESLKARFICFETACESLDALRIFRTTALDFWTLHKKDEKDADIDPELVQLIQKNIDLLSKTAKSTVRNFEKWETALRAIPKSNAIHVYHAREAARLDLEIAAAFTGIKEWMELHSVELSDYSKDVSKQIAETEDPMSQAALSLRMKSLDRHLENLSKTKNR